MEEQRQFRCLCDSGCGKTVSQEKPRCGDMQRNPFTYIDAVSKSPCSHSSGLSWGHVDDMTTPTQDKAQ